METYKASEQYGIVDRNGMFVRLVDGKVKYTADVNFAHAWWTLASVNKVAESIPNCKVVSI